MRATGAAQNAREERLWALSFVIAATFVLGACQSMDVGTAVESPRHQDDGLTLPLLDPGNYPTTAIPLPRTLATATGVILEGQQMADVVVILSEVDSGLRQLRPSNTGAVDNALALRADIGLSRATVPRLRQRWAIRLQNVVRTTRRRPQAGHGTISHSRRIPAPKGSRRRSDHDSASLIQGITELLQLAFRANA
jgi:hypothetical protein